MDGEPVPGYAEELGPRQRHRDLRRDQGPYRQLAVEGGSFLPSHRQAHAGAKTEIFIQFRDIPFSIFASRGATTKPNTLAIDLQPDETISLTVMAKVPGLDREGVRLRAVPLDIGLANAFSEYRRRIAYERLLLDLIEGDPTLFVRRDEVEAQWAWIDRIRAGWAAEGMKPQPYAAGTWGPETASKLAEDGGIAWAE